MKEILEKIHSEQQAQTRILRPLHTEMQDIEHRVRVLANRFKKDKKSLEQEEKEKDV